MPWSSRGNEALWVNAYRRAADIFRSVSPSFRFDWNGDPGYLQGQTSAYPGDNYVDIVGMDLYDKGMNASWNPSTRTWNDPAAAFATEIPNLRFRTRLRDRARQAGQLSGMGVGERWRRVAEQRGQRRPRVHPGHVRLDERPAEQWCRQPGVPVVLQRGHVERRQPHAVALPERGGPLPSLFGPSSTPVDRPPATRAAPRRPESDDTHDEQVTPPTTDAPTTTTTTVPDSPTPAAGQAAAARRRTGRRQVICGRRVDHATSRPRRGSRARTARPTSAAGRTRAST